jgi:hypothetical protein
MRIITEAIWHGPKRDIVAHRTVHKGKSPYRKITGVRFSDGTFMDVTHRKALPREKIETINGYSRLFDDNWSVVGEITITTMNQRK